MISAALFLPQAVGGQQLLSQAAAISRQAAGCQTGSSRPGQPSNSGSMWGSPPAGSRGTEVSRERQHEQCCSNVAAPWLHTMLVAVLHSTSVLLAYTLASLL